MNNSKDILIDQRWSRLLQPSNYAWNSEDPFVGGQLSPDPEIEDINDLARFIQIATMAPFPVVLIMGLTVGNSCYEDNVFLYDAAEDEVAIPVNFIPAWNRIKDQYGLKICQIGSLVKRKTPLEHTNSMLTFSTLVVDTKRKVAHRIDPEKTEKPALDKAIQSILNEVKSGCAYIPPEKEQNNAGALYRQWDVMCLDSDQVPVKFPEYVHYKMWTYWLLHQRLWFSDDDHNKVWEDFLQKFRNLEFDKLANLILNFYPEFTGLAHYNAFGRDDFLNERYRVEELWIFNEYMDARLIEASYGGF